MPDELDEFEELINPPEVPKPTKRQPRPPRPSRAAQVESVEGQGEVQQQEVVKVVNLDRRKLSKKQQKQLTDKWNGDHKGSVVDVVFKSQIEAARREYGHTAVMVGGPDENVLIGIPCPSIAFEYLITQSVFPLGLIIHLVGPPHSCKSPLLYEFMRWFRVAGGGSILQEAESKFSQELLHSIVGIEEGEVNVIVNRCNSVEDWQRKLLYWINYEKKALDGTKQEPGPGRTVPILFGVDSIMGKAAEETQEKVMDAGSAGRSYPIEALSITTFMRTVPQQVDGFPFTIVLNNHLKMGKDDMGNDVRGMAGGQGVRFQESFEIETKIRNAKISCAAWEGVVINLKCFKNAFGPGQRSIDARLLWWEEETEPGSGIYKQVTKWDWDWATIRLLTTAKERDAANLKKHGFHIAAPKTSLVENLAWSANLGMKEKNAVPWSELGKMLREDPVTLKVLRDALGIKRRPVLQGDYLRQFNNLIEEPKK